MGACHMPTGVYLVGLCTRETRLPGDRPMERFKVGYPATIVGSEPHAACIKANWVTFSFNAIGIEVSEETQWYNISTCPSVDFDSE